MYFSWTSTIISKAKVYMFKCSRINVKKKKITWVCFLKGRRNTPRSAELVTITVGNFALTFAPSPVCDMHWIFKDWFWQFLLWTKVSGIRYVQLAVYDHWPFNRLGSLKLLADSPVDLFLMCWDFFFFSCSKAPFYLLPAVQLKPKWSWCES